MTLKARLARLEARLWPRSLAEFPASQLWLGLLECAEQLFFAEGPAKVRKRLRDGIAFLQGYVARRQLGAQVEQLCAEWVAGFDGETGRGAFVDTDIAQVMRARDRMDQGVVAATGETTGNALEERP